MTPIDWVEVLETGVPALDEDHRHLIAQCNALTAADEANAPWPTILALAEALARDCTRHFREEEEILERTELSRRQQHRQQHLAIERRFAELLDFLRRVDGTKVEDREAVHRMRDMLIDILFRHDLDYKSHLQQAAGL